MTALAMSELAGFTIGVTADRRRDELEAAMARHVETYVDEWRATVDDPDRLTRFVSFVNAPDVPDPTITFDVERGQPVPAHPGRQPVLLGMPR